MLLRKHPDGMHVVKHEQATYSALPPGVAGGKLGTGIRTHTLQELKS